MGTTRKNDLGSRKNPVQTRSMRETNLYLSLLTQYGQIPVKERLPDTEDGLLHYVFHLKGKCVMKNVYVNCHSDTISYYPPDTFEFMSNKHMYLHNSEEKVMLIDQILHEDIGIFKSSGRNKRFQIDKEIGLAAVRFIKWDRINRYLDPSDRPDARMIGGFLYIEDSRMASLYELARGLGKLGPDKRAPLISWEEWQARYRKKYSMLE